MKKIFLLFLSSLLIATSFSQTIVNRAAAVNTVSDARLQAGLNFFVPRFADTTAANVQKGIDSAGALIFTYDVNGYWYRQSSPKKWDRVGTTTTSYTAASGVKSSSNTFVLDGNWKNLGSLDLTGCTTLDAFGDSWTKGTISDNPAKIYPKRLADSLAVTLQNRGVDAGAYYMCVDTLFGTNMLSSNRTGLVTLLTGTVDVFSGGSTQLNRNKVANLAMTFVANCFLKTAVPMSDASVTKVSFGAGVIDCASKSTVIGGNIEVATTNGATITFTATTTSVKQCIVIGTYASVTGTTMSALNVSVDGHTSYMTYSGSELYPTPGVEGFFGANEFGLHHYPSVIVLRGLSAGAHTIILTTTSASPAYLDYYGITEDPSLCKPVVVGSIPHLDPQLNLNYAIGTRPKQNDNADILSSVIRDALNDYFPDYPLSFVDPNQYFIPSYGIQHPDNLHPQSNRGDSALYQAFRDGVTWKHFAPIQVSKLNYTVDQILANNGLTLSNTTDIFTVKLGGTLLATTTIDATSFDLSITGANTSSTKFTMLGTAPAIIGTSGSGGTSPTGLQFVGKANGGGVLYGAVDVQGTKLNGTEIGNNDIMFNVRGVSTNRFSVYGNGAMSLPQLNSYINIGYDFSTAYAEIATIAALTTDHKLGLPTSTFSTNALFDLGSSSTTTGRTYRTTFGVDTTGAWIQSRKTLNVGTQVAYTFLYLNPLGGDILVGALKTTGSAPTQSGTIKMVTTDDNGKVGFQTGVPISSLMDATASNSVAVGNNQQTWLWGGLTSTGLSLGSTTTASTSNSTLLKINRDGANASSAITTYGLTVANAHTGTTSTNVALYTSATGGTNNYAAIFNAGNVGIGTAAPTAQLHIAAGLATAGTSPLKFTTGTLLTSPEVGAMEYDGSRAYFTNGIGTRGEFQVNKVVLSNSGSPVTITTNYNIWVWYGTTATYTLPAVSVANTNYLIIIKNRGSGNVTLNSNAGGNDIYTASAVNTITIAPGESYTLIMDGTYWIVI